MHTINSMSPPIPRVPLTANQPEACPYCGGRTLTRRGTRRKKLEIVQLWRCASCKRTITPGPAALHNKTYPLRMILSALTDYDLGYTLEATARRLKKKSNRSVSPSTITSWLNEYRQHCSYRRLRAEGLRRFPANQTIRSIKLYHRQIYSYAYHRPKLDLVRTGRLDNKRAGDTQLACVADFLERIPSTCPHDLFRRDDDPKTRASQATPAWADISRIVVNRKQNAATDAAALIIPAVGNNKLRHETLQHFNVGQR
jgi:transposase-like protein